jgi:hypothetical protein
MLNAFLTLDGKSDYILTWRVDVMAKLRSALME